MTKPRSHKAAKVRHEGQRPNDARRFWRGLIAICAVGAVLRVAILVEYLQSNPFAYAPITDGAVYWDWAGRIAAGQWTGQTPFHSAPLYPYLIGGLRALGAGLPTVYVLQIAMDVLTAAALGWIGRARFGSAVGLAAAVAWLIIDEPAFYTTRVLNSTLQVFLVVGLWVLLVRWQRRPAWSLAASIGAVLGLNCLANPAMMLLVPILPLWAIAQAWSDRRQAGDSSAAARSPQLGPVAGQTAVGLAIAVVFISPATWHNWRACGEFIPITACPGITLRQGNGPGAVGTYVAIPGVSHGREHLFADAARVYQQATGRPVRWRDVDAFFRDQALAYWREDPARAAGLILRRIYWFASGRYYCDVHQPTWERDQGFAQLLWLAPVPTAWLIGPGLVGMAALIRRWRRFGPEWLLLALPLLVVAVFQYSPRYRLPAIPVLVVMAAWAAMQAVRWRENRRWTIAAAVAAVIAIALGPVNRATGFEDPAGLAYNNEYNVAIALGKVGRKTEAMARLRRALRILPTSPDAHNDMGALLAEEGRWDEAIRHYQQALQSRPGWATAECNLGVAYASLGQLDKGIEHYRRAQQRRDDWPEIAYNLANALADSGRTAEAVEQFLKALRLRPDYVDARDHLGVVLARLGRDDEAIDEWQRVLRTAPGRRVTRNRLAMILSKTKRYDQAIAVLREGVRRQPDDLSTANNLVWLLATCPRDPLRRGAEAVALGERICRTAAWKEPALLDSLAAAYAETKQFDKAVETASRALTLLGKDDTTGRAARLTERLELYRRGRPFRGKD